MLNFLSNTSVDNSKTLVVVFIRKDERRGQKRGYNRKLSEPTVLLLAVLLLVRDQIY